MKRTLILLATAALVLLLAGVGLAAEKKAEKPKKLDRKEQFIESCKGCHGEDAAAGEYAPMFLIIEQWERFFDEDYLDTHGELTVSEDDTTRVVDTISPAMLKVIRKFCVDGAADSEHPMTCG